MLALIKSVNNAVNNFIWGVPAMILLMGVGLYLSAGTRFVQLRKFGPAMKATLGRIFKHDKAGKGALTPFQAVCTALAATVGTGNIAGVAGAIAIGGPGAVFWMWVSALLGMCTKFAEVTLAVHFRERNQHGDYVGGPMYYIQNGLGRKWRWLAYAYALLGALACFGIGNTPTPPWWWMCRTGNWSFCNPQKPSPARAGGGFALPTRFPLDGEFPQG